MQRQDVENNCCQVLWHSAWPFFGLFSSKLFVNMLFHRYGYMYICHHMKSVAATTVEYSISFLATSIRTLILASLDYAFANRVEQLFQSIIFLNENINSNVVSYTKIYQRYIVSSGRVAFSYKQAISS